MGPTLALLLVVAELLAVVVGLLHAHQPASGFGQLEDTEEWEESSALDPAISRALAKVHPPRPSSLVRSLREPVQEDAATDLDSVVWYFAAHHKSGTDLLRQLAREQASYTGMEMCASHGMFGWRPEGCNHKPLDNSSRVWFHHEFTSKSLRGRRWRNAKYRAVHMMRDPIAMVISGYIFHNKSKDTPPWLLGERHQPLVGGLSTEARFVLRGTGKNMVDTYKNGPQGHMLHLRLEDFESSFDTAAERMYNFTVGDFLRRQNKSMGPLVQQASLHDLSRHPKAHSDGHVADDNVESLVRNALGKIPKDLLRELEEMRAELGY